MSNLEPGCKAIIIKGFCNENYGKIVIVGNFIGRHPYDTGNWDVTDYWEIDQEILFMNEYQEKAYFKLCSGKTMRRIDDHNTDEFFTTEKELLTVLWKNSFV